MTDTAPLTKHTLCKLIRLHPKLTSTSPRTLRRWALVGVRGVKLQAEMVGGRLMAALADVDAFLEAVNATRAPEATPLVRSPHERHRASKAAAAELRAAGC